jgi:peptide-methionine (S)-S-oxide reductase
MLRIKMLLIILLGGLLIEFKVAIAEQINTSKSEAIFAGGCFWCMEKDFDSVPGVLATISGYTGGSVKNPSYEQVSAGATGHLEALKIIYDPGKVSYEKLLDVFWHNIDPTNDEGQFCDTGNEYRSAIFFQDDEQKRLAEHSKASLEKNKPFPEPIVTLIRPAIEFFAAENYHQDYYLKNPVRYKFYRYHCGRDQRLGELWGNH